MKARGFVALVTIEEITVDVRAKVLPHPFATCDLREQYGISHATARRVCIRAEEHGQLVCTGQHQLSSGGAAALWTLTAIDPDAVPVMPSLSPMQDRTLAVLTETPQTVRTVARLAGLAPSRARDALDHLRRSGRAEREREGSVWRWRAAADRRVVLDIAEAAK